MGNQTSNYKNGFDENYTYFECKLDPKDTPLIFIHGVGLNTSMWSKQKKYFHKNFLFYDLLNHGKTKKKIKKLK